MTTLSNESFTIESFYRYVGEGKLMAAKCNKCGKVMLPPRPVCPKCFSKDMKWVELKPRGRLLTYTVIHVSPKQFESLVPYPLGIIRLEDGTQFVGMIRGVEQKDLKVGMPLIVDFEKASSGKPSEQTNWPAWPRYYFKPA